MSNVTEYVSGSPGTTELRKTSNSTANAFVTVTYSYEMESKGFAQLFSYPCNGLNPAAGFWRFFFIDSRNWSPSKVIIISNHFSILPNIEKIHILMTDDHINIRPKHPSGRISVSQ